MSDCLLLRRPPSTEAGRTPLLRRMRSRRCTEVHRWAGAGCHCRCCPSWRPDMAGTRLPDTKRRAGRSVVVGTAAAGTGVGRREAVCTWFPSRKAQGMVVRSELHRAGRFHLGLVCARVCRDAADGDDGGVSRIVPREDGARGSPRSAHTVVAAVRDLSSSPRALWPYRSAPVQSRSTSWCRPPVPRTRRSTRVPRRAPQANACACPELYSARPCA